MPSMKESEEPSSADAAAADEVVGDDDPTTCVGEAKKMIGNGESKKGKKKEQGTAAVKDETDGKLRSPGVVGGSGRGGGLIGGGVGGPPAPRLPPAPMLHFHPAPYFVNQQYPSRPPPLPPPTLPAGYNEPLSVEQLEQQAALLEYQLLQVRVRIEAAKRGQIAGRASRIVNGDEKMPHYHDVRESVNGKQKKKKKAKKKKRHRSSDSSEEEDDDAVVAKALVRARARAANGESTIQLANESVTAIENAITQQQNDAEKIISNADAEILGIITGKGSKFPPKIRRINFFDTHEFTRVRLYQSARVPHRQSDSDSKACSLCQIDQNSKRKTTKICSVCLIPLCTSRIANTTETCFEKWHRCHDLREGQSEQQAALRAQREGSRLAGKYSQARTARKRYAARIRGREEYDVDNNDDEKKEDADVKEEENTQPEKAEGNENEEEDEGRDNINGDEEEQYDNVEELEEARVECEEEA